MQYWVFCVRITSIANGEQLIPIVRSDKHQVQLEKVGARIGMLNTMIVYEHYKIFRIRKLTRETEQHYAFLSPFRYSQVMEIGNLRQSGTRSSEYCG